MRAAISAEADQVEGLRALGELGRQVMLEQHDRRPVPAGKLSRICPADSVTEPARPVSVTTAR
jgi:hypothetical protein